MNTIETLRNTLLFAKLDETQLSEIVSHSKEATFPADKTIIKEGDQADYLYVIKEGSLQVYTWDSNHQEIVLARREKGDFVGEQALLLTTPGRRNANVRTLTKSTLIKIRHSDFLQALEGNVELKNELKKTGMNQLLSSLKAKEPNFDFLTARGEMTLYMDEFMHMPAAICKFKLNDGREILTACVVGKNIRSIREANTDNATSLCYESKTEYRELLLKEDRLVGVVAYGEWNAVKELYARVFEGKSVTAEEMKNFMQCGDVIFHEVIGEENAEQIICDCMCLNRGEILSYIERGCTSVDEIGLASGAGTVCGSCIPTLEAMLGHPSWIAMHILHIEELTPDVRAFRLSPVQNRPLKPFKAGQHVVIQCQIKGFWVERSYTLVSAPGNPSFYEIAIKREDKGLLSRWIFENGEKVSFVRVSHPAGNLSFDATLTTPLICFTAGIGVTPAVCFARTVVESKAQRPLYIFTSARNQDYLAYDSELQTLASQSQTIQYSKRLTQIQGRLKPEEIVSIAKSNPEAYFFICGPKGFEVMVKTALQTAAIPENKITIELFTHAGGPRN